MVIWGIRIIGNIFKLLMIMGFIEHIAPGLSHKTAYEATKTLMSLLIGG